MQRVVRRGGIFDTKHMLNLKQHKQRIRYILSVHIMHILSYEEHLNIYWQL